jgi:hypothetical protein
MRDFFKKLFAGKEPESVSLALTDIPDLIRNREKAARSALEENTREPIRNIRNAVAQLQLIVNTIAGAEHDPEIHPRLKNIAKNTLPQYVRAMNTALAKDLPDDPEEFYTASVECVKNCLNSIKGPGRYLQIVFPEEMKASRNGIDAIGREINRITTAIGEYRRETAAISQVRAHHAAILDARAGLLKAEEKSRRVIQRIREITDRLSGIEREEKAMPADPGMAEVEERRASLQVLERDRDEKARAYAALSMTTSHVFRKAEKIASRQRHAEEVLKLKHAMHILSDHELPDPDELQTALAAACPVAERMIALGEIALKNKEERAVFSDPGSFCSEMCRTCAELRTHEVAHRDAQETLLAHPLLMKAGSLEREKTQLGLMLEKEQHTQQELDEWQRKTRNHVPVLTEELRKHMEALLGKQIHLLDDNHPPSA